MQTPQSLDTNSLFEINLDRQLPKGIIPLDMLHNINHKQPHELIILLLIMAHTDVKLFKNTVLCLLGRVNNIASIHNLFLGEDADHQKQIARHNLSRITSSKASTSLSGTVKFPNTSP